MTCSDCADLCPVCCDPPDWCQGHGESGDPAGYAILMKHEAGDHEECRPCNGYCVACTEAAQ